MGKIETLVSVAAIVKDCASTILPFAEEMTDVLDSHYSNYELLLIDNGAVIATQKAVQEVLATYRCVRYLQLARSTDEETAIMVGLDAAIGDYVITIDPNLDPPANVVRMVELCRSGTDLVLGVDQTERRPGLLYSALRRTFLSLSRWLVGVDFLTGTTGLRALSRQAVNALIKVRLRRRYFAVLVSDLGLAIVSYPYEQVPRTGRKPSHNLLRALQIGASFLVHNSLMPLRIASALGIAGSSLSLLYSLYVLFVYMFKSDVMPGWTTLSLAVSGLFALSFLMFALIGEYLGRLLEESAHRPLYHVREELSSAVMLADLRRHNVLDRSEESTETNRDNTR